MRILLVEDDRSLQLAVAYKLQKEGFELTACEDGREGLSALRAQAFDLVLLDRMLPGLHGDALLRAAREDGLTVPILMMTAMDAVPDRVGGLDAGADDYLVKPFAMEELMARIRALLRRSGEDAVQKALSVGDLSCDVDRCELTCQGRVQALSPREMALMACLLRNVNRIMPRALLMDRVWSDNIVEDGNLDIYIHFLRKHLTALRSHLRIETVRGVGYRLVA